nr:PREDICTED: uncharacterized protein LOC105670080 [Linepithema humile]
MGAFLENPMFFFVDDAKPILPIFRPLEYGHSDKIVELMDAECDTETTFPIRNGNYSGGKALRNNHNYVDVYIDIDYDSEEPYKNLDLSKSAFATKYKDDYYTQYVASQNTIGHSRKERFAQYDYSRDFESPFARSNRAHQGENTFSQRYTDKDERNLHEIHTVDVQPRQTKILSKTDEIYDYEAEFRKTRNMEHQDIFSDAVDSNVLPKNDFWDFVPLENEENREELTFSDPDSVKNHSGSQRIMPQRKRLHNFNTQQKRDIVDFEKEESENMQQNNSQENFSPKTWTGSARYQSRKSDAMTETPKVLQLNMQNTNSPQVRPVKTFIDEQISNTSSAKKHLSKAKPRSAIERKKNISSSTVVHKKETVNAISARTSADDRRYRNKFVNKLSNKFSNEMVRSAKTFKRIADSKSDERAYKANERNNTTLHRGNLGSSKIDRRNVSISRSTLEEEVGKTERIFSLRMTGTPLRTKVEKEKKRNLSRLPIRTWKRLRTKEPAALRLESNIINEKISQKLQKINIEVKNSKDHSKRVEDNEVREAAEDDCATANRSDIKQNIRFRTGLFGADKPRLTSSNLKDLNPKSLNTTKRIYAKRNKKINIK